MNAVQPYLSGEDAGTFPRGGTVEQIWEFPLRYAVQAPSGHNTQPWRFHIADGRLHLYAVRSRALPVVDPQDREGAPLRIGYPLTDGPIARPTPRLTVADVLTETITDTGTSP